MSKITAYLGLFLFAIMPLTAQEVEYSPGGRKAHKVWDKFYKGDHEPELPLPLVAAGTTMVPAICAAVAHPDMRLRRYAISALGTLRDKRALGTLTKILRNNSEIDYFRGDALEAIYQIDRKLGLKLSGDFKNEPNYLQGSVSRIQREEKLRLQGKKIIHRSKDTGD